MEEPPQPIYITHSSFFHLNLSTIKTTEENFNVDTELMMKILSKHL